MDKLNIKVSGVADTTTTLYPILIAILPKQLNYINGSEHVIYTDYTKNKTYNSLDTGFPLNIPDTEVIENYNNTGDTLLRWNFKDLILSYGDSINVYFDSMITAYAADSFFINAYEGVPENNFNQVQNSVTDTNDLDNDNLTTTDELSHASIQRVILNSSEFLIDKYVKGELDTEFKADTQVPDGDNVTFRLLITNNHSVDLKDLEIIDILPYTNDTGVIDTSSRGSQFDMYAASKVEAQLTNALNPAPVENSDITTLRSIKVTTSPTLILHPYDQLIIDIISIVPIGEPE